MTIRAKLITAFTLTVIVTIAACLFIYFELEDVDTTYSDMLDNSVPKTYSNAELNRFAMNQASLVQSYIMGKDTKEAISASRDEVNQMISELEKNIDKHQAKAQKLLLNIKEKATIMDEGFDQAIAIKDSQGFEAASKYYIEVADTNVINFMNDSTALFSEVTKAFDDTQKAAKDDTQFAFLVTNIAIIIVIVVGILFTVLLIRGIAKPIHQLRETRTRNCKRKFSH